MIMGHPGELREAEMMLNHLEIAEDLGDSDRFEIAEVRVAENSKLSGQTLADLRFGQQRRVTVVGIQRGQEQITTVKPTEQVLAGDCLIVIGTLAAVNNLKQEEPL